MRLARSYQTKQKCASDGRDARATSESGTVKQSLDDLFVEHEASDGFLEPTVLFFEFLEPLDLVVAHAPELLSPSVQRLLADLELLTHLTCLVTLAFYRKPPGHLVPQRLSLSMDLISQGRPVENGGHKWASPSLSKWSQQQASLQIDYSA